MAEWNCVACTFLNPASRNQCEICCTAKPGATIETRSERETLWNQQVVTMPSSLAVNLKPVASNTATGATGATGATARPRPNAPAQPRAWKLDATATSGTYANLKPAPPRTIKAPAIPSLEDLDKWQHETSWEDLVAQIEADIKANKRPDWFKLNLAMIGAAERLPQTKDDDAALPDSLHAFLNNDKGCFAKSLEYLLDTVDSDFSLSRAWTDLVRSWKDADKKRDSKDDDAEGAAENGAAGDAAATATATSPAQSPSPPHVSKLADADEAAAAAAEREAEEKERLEKKGNDNPDVDGPLASRMKESFQDGFCAAAKIFGWFVHQQRYEFKLTLLGALLNPKTRRYQHQAYVSASSNSSRNANGAASASGNPSYASYASTRKNVGAPHLHAIAHETFAALGGYTALANLAEHQGYYGPSTEKLLAVVSLFAQNAEAIVAENKLRTLVEETTRSLCSKQLDWPLEDLLDGAKKDGNAKKGGPKDGAVKQQKLMDGLTQIAEACGAKGGLPRLVVETDLAQNMRFVQSDKLRFRRFGIEQLGKLSSTLTTSQKLSVQELTALYKSRGVYEEILGDRMDERVVSCSEVLLKNSALDVEILDLLLANTNSRAVRKMLTAVVLQPTFTEELAQHMLLEVSRAVVYQADYGAYKLIVALLASEAYTRESLIRKGPLAMQGSLGALWTLLFCISVQAPAHLVSSTTAVPPRTESPARENMSARKRPMPGRTTPGALQQHQQHQQQLRSIDSHKQQHQQQQSQQQQQQQHLQQEQDQQIPPQQLLDPQPSSDPITTDGPEQDSDPLSHTIIGALGLSPERMEELMLAFDRVAKDCTPALRLRFAERALELIKRTQMANVNANAVLADVEVQDSLSMGFFAADDDDEALAPISGSETCAMRSEETLVEPDGLRVTTTTPETVVAAYEVFRSLILSSEKTERPGLISELDDAWDLKNLLLGEFDAFLRLSPVRARLDKIEASIETQAANAASIAVTSAAAAAAFEGSIAQLTMEESRCADELQQHERARLKTLSALVKNSDHRLILTAEDMERLWTSCCMPCFDSNLGNYTTQETFMLWLRVSCFDDMWSCVEPDVCKFVLSELFQNRLDLVRVGPKTYHCLQAHFTFVNVHNKLLEAIDTEAVAEPYKFKSRGPPKGLEGSNLVGRRISVLLKTGRMAPGKIIKYISWSNLHKIEYVNGFSEEKDLSRLDSWFLLPPIERAMAGRVDFKEVNVLDLAGRETIWAVALHGELPVVAVQAFNLLLGLYERVRLAMLSSGDSEGEGSSPEAPEVDLFVEHIFDELESFLGGISVRGDAHSVPASAASSPSSLQHVSSAAPGTNGAGIGGHVGLSSAQVNPGGSNGGGANTSRSGSESQFGVESDYADGSFLPRCIQYLHLYVKQLEWKLDSHTTAPRKLAGLGTGEALILKLDTEENSLKDFFNAHGGLQTHTRASVRDVIYDLASVVGCDPGIVKLRFDANENEPLASSPHDVSISMSNCGNLVLEELGLAGVAPVRMAVQVARPAPAKPVVGPGTKMPASVVPKTAPGAPKPVAPAPADVKPSGQEREEKDKKELASAKEKTRVLRSARCFGFTDMCKSNFTSSPGGLVSCQSERVEILLKLLELSEREDRLEVLELLMNVPPFLREMQHLLVPSNKTAASACSELLLSLRETDLWRVAYTLKLLGDLVLFPNAKISTTTMTTASPNEEEATGSGTKDAQDAPSACLNVGGIELGRPLADKEFFQDAEALPGVLRVFLTLVRQCGVPGMHRRSKSAAVSTMDASVHSSGTPHGLSESARIQSVLSMNEPAPSDPSALFATLPMMARTVRLSVEALMRSSDATSAQPLMDETSECLLRVILLTRDELERRKSGRSSHSCNCFGDFLGVPLDTNVPTGDAQVDAEAIRVRSTEPPPLDQTLLGLRAPVCAFCLNTRRLVRAVLHLLAALESIVLNLEPISNRLLSRGSTCTTLVRQLVLYCTVSELRREVCAMLKRVSVKLPQHRASLGQAIREAERELETQRHSMSCDDFFDLLLSFVPDTSAGGTISAQDHELVHRMVALVLEWPDRAAVEESGMEEAETNLFVGFLQVLARILQRHETLRQQAAKTRLSRAKYGDDNLVRVLWNRFVVGEPNARPVCETPSSRRALTELLCTLTCDDLLQANTLAGMIEEFSSMTPTPLREALRGRALVQDWEFEPLPQGNFSSEFRGRNQTGHAGLRNRGSTCYINSLLQLLFHVPRFRRCILSAPVTPPHSLVSGSHQSGGSGSESGSVGNSTSSRKTPDLEENKVVVGWLCVCSGINDLNASTCHICSSSKSADAEMVTESFRPGAGGGSSTGGSADGGNGGDDAQYNMEVLRQLQRTFRFMQDCNKGCFDPMNFVESCAALKLQFPVTSQNDTSEFYDKLLDNLESSLESTPFLDEMKECFLGRQTKLKKCHTCGRVSTSREESFYRLELMTKDNSVEKNSLQECLDSFVAPEVMSGDNKVDCDQCQARMPCTFVSCMTELPDYLFIHPKRFTFDLHTMQTVKLNHRITFPTHLDMFPYTRDGRGVEAERQARLVSTSGGSAENGNSSTKDRFDANSFWTNGRMSERDIENARVKCQYVLSGVLVHRGRAGGGHYYSFKHVSHDSIMERAEEGHMDGASLFTSPKQGWFRFDDSKVMPFEPSSAHSGLDTECFGGNIERTSTTSWGTVRAEKVEREWSAFMLLYERVEEAIEGSVLGGKPVGAGSNPGSDLPFSPLPRRSSLLSSTPHSPVLSSLLTASRSNRRRGGRRLKRHKSSEAERRRFALATSASPHAAMAVGAGSGASASVMRRIDLPGKIGSKQAGVVPQSLKESTLSGLIVKHRDWVSKRFYALLNEEVRISNAAYAKQAVLFDQLVVSMALQQLLVAQDKSVKDPEPESADFGRALNSDVLAVSLEDEAADQGDEAREGSNGKSSERRAADLRESVCESSLRVFAHVVLRIRQNDSTCLRKWTEALLNALTDHPRLARVVLREVAQEKAVYLDELRAASQTNEMETAIHQLSRLQQYSGALQQVGNPLLSTRGFRAQFLDCPHRPSFQASLRLFIASIKIVVESLHSTPENAVQSRERSQVDPDPMSDREALKDVLERMLEEVGYASKHAHSLERFGQVWAELAALDLADVRSVGTELDAVAFLAHLLLGIRSPADKFEGRSDLPTVGVPEGSAMPNIVPLMRAIRFFAGAPMLSELARFILGSQAFLDNVFALYTSGETGMREMIEDFVRRDLFRTTPVLAKGITQVRENAGFCQYASTTSSGERPTKAHQSFQLLCTVGAMTTGADIQDAIAYELCAAMRKELDKSLSRASAEKKEKEEEEEEDPIEQHARGVVAGKSTFGVSQFLVFMLATFVELSKAHEDFAPRWAGANYKVWRPFMRWLELVSPPHNKSFLQGFPDDFVERLLSDLQSMRDIHVPEEMRREVEETENAKRAEASRADDEDAKPSAGDGE